MKDLSCDLCLLQFDKKYVYNVHMTLVHKKTNYHTDSPQIDKIAVIKENTDLCEEVACESKKEKKSHKCKICSYSCATKGDLKIHINSIHEEKKLLKCSICDYSFSRRDNLKRHIDAVHEGKKPYKCSICDYSCARKASLKIHIDAVHEGKKPHKCSICDYSCSKKFALKRHIVAVHEECKPPPIRTILN